MIPKITTGGKSFKGAFQYYLHDKDKTTRERVAWTHTENLLTDDPDKAWRVMAYTAKEAERLKEASGQKMTGRKLSKPVFAYSLSWHPEQEPDQEHMLATAKQSLDILGFTEHETVIIAHRDEPQRHVHVIVNRVHPLTGIAGDTGNSKLKLSDFALAYELEQGKVYCQQREENHRKRTQGERTQYRDQVIVEAWKLSDNGHGFAAALKDKGYHLAQGRKRFVVVDPYGQTHNPTRHLENVRAKEFQKRLQDVELTRLPDAAKLSRDIQADNRRRYDESLKYDQQVMERTNQLQTKHREQRAKVVHHFEDKLARQRESLTERYRSAEQRDKIEALQEKTKRVNWLKRMFGTARKEQELLREMESSRRQVEGRAREQFGKIAAEREQSLGQLGELQAMQKERKAGLWQSQKPAGYVNENEREKIMQRLREQRQSSRTRNGPSLER